MRELKNKKVKVKKSHGCVWCGELILLGESASYRVYIDHGFHADYIHPECFDACQECEGADEGFNEGMFKRGSCDPRWGGGNRVKICSVEGCEKVVKRRGYCVGHLAQIERHGTITHAILGPPKKQILDLTGQRFNRLVVVGLHPHKTKYGSARWICRCDCGKETVVASGNLRSRHTFSCGCLRRPHGGFGTKIHEVWHGMKGRCLNPSDKRFKDYGGRGISIREEWMEFIPFRDWATSHGFASGLQIDRIDVNGNYEPSNCRFVTCRENKRNRRNIKLDHQKVATIKKLLEDPNNQNKGIAKAFGVSAGVISQIKHGYIWPEIQAEGKDAA